MSLIDVFKNLKKNCKCCGGSFATGKEYGGYWFQSPITGLPEGLCGFCNPENKKWYIEDLKCHKND